MRSLRKSSRTGRSKARAAAATLSVAAALVTGMVMAPSAQAAGANWDGWSGSCYGWTTWNTNQVTGHTWDHSSDWCQITIYQRDATTGGISSRSSYTQGDQTGADTPAYWHGWGSNGHLLQDSVCVQDISNGAPQACSGYIYY